MRCWRFSSFRLCPKKKGSTRQSEVIAMTVLGACVICKAERFYGPAKNRPCSLKNPSVNPQIHPNTRWSIRHNQWYHKVPNLESKRPQSLSGCSDWSLAAPRRPSTWPPTWTWQIDFTSQQPARCQTQPGSRWQPHRFQPFCSQYIQSRRLYIQSVAQVLGRELGY